MKNKINLLLLSAIITIFVAGCGKNQTEEIKPLPPTPPSTTLVVTKPPLVKISINDSLRRDASQQTGVDWTDASKDSVALIADSGKLFLTEDEVAEAKALPRTKLVDFVAKGNLNHQWYAGPTKKGYYLLIYHKVGVFVSYLWVPKKQATLTSNDLTYTGVPDFQLYYGRIK